MRAAGPHLGGRWTARRTAPGCPAPTAAADAQGQEHHLGIEPVGEHWELVEAAVELRSLVAEPAPATVPCKAADGDEDQDGLQGGEVSALGVDLPGEYDVEQESGHGEED